MRPIPLWEHRTAGRIVDQVATRTGITRTAILGRDRFAEVVHARHLAMWLIRTQLDWSYPQIGRWFGRDHTTVIHGVGRIDAMRRVNRGLAEWLDEHGSAFVEVDT